MSHIICRYISYGNFLLNPFLRSLADVLERHFKHRKKQVVDLFDSFLEDLMKDQMNGLISYIDGRSPFL